MSIKFHIPEKLDRKKAHTWIASWFGSGFISPAPGTWGSLAAIPFGVLIFAIGGAASLACAALVVSVIGLWAAYRFDKDMDGHDSKMIVIDEVAGQWIALIPAALNPFLILFAFLMFRFFDILKPWPISFCDKKISGSPGVMLDDIVAGYLAGLCVMVLGMLL
jgi:phosphatidylglycerophosphatase A